jgi:hypothetical protein
MKTPEKISSTKKKICESCKMKKACGDLPGFCLFVYYGLIALVVVSLLYLLITMEL